MRRVITGALLLVVLVGLAAGSVSASSLEGLWMSLTPEGTAQTGFPSGVEVVYVTFEYRDFVSDTVRVVVSDHRGNIVARRLRSVSGSGIVSIPVTYGQQTAFPDGPYVTTLYYGGLYLTRAVEWSVGSPSPPTPTPLPPPRLKVEPDVLVFSADQGGPDPSSQRVLISNSTAVTSIWRASAPATWLSLGSPSGSTPALLRVYVDTSGLPAGTYRTELVVSADGVENSPQTVPITLTVAPPDGTVTLNLATVESATGWVVSDETDNHFGADEILAGTSGDRDYVGGLTFDLSSLSGLPNLRAAAVLLRGVGWDQRPDDGGWMLELLSGDVADGWSDIDYAGITEAVAVATLEPEHTPSNLAADEESVWHLDASALDVLESMHDEADVVHLRLRYVPEDEADDGLFSWSAAGYLRVNFEPDSGGPLPTVTPTKTSATATPTAVLLPSGGRPGQESGLSVTDVFWLFALIGVTSAAGRRYISSM